MSKMNFCIARETARVNVYSTGSENLLKQTIVPKTCLVRYLKTSLWILKSSLKTNLEYIPKFLNLINLYQNLWITCINYFFITFFCGFHILANTNKNYSRKILFSIGFVGSSGVIINGLSRWNILHRKQNLVWIWMIFLKSFFWYFGWYQQKLWSTVAENNIFPSSVEWN